MKPRSLPADDALAIRHGARGDGLKDWLSLLLPPLAIVGTLVGFWMILRAATLPAAMPVTTISAASFASPPPSTYPPEVIEMAVAVSTSLAPTPEPTPTPYQTPTPPVPTIYCGINSDPGQPCQWPPATIIPTPAPTLPPCLTPMPESECVWLGAISGTPVGAIGTDARGI